MWTAFRPLRSVRALPGPGNEHKPGSHASILTVQPAGRSVQVECNISTLAELLDGTLLAELLAKMFQCLAYIERMGDGVTHRYCRFSGQVHSTQRLRNPLVCSLSI